MIIRKNARRSLLTLAVTGALPLGAQASTYFNLPTFSCGGTSGSSLESINWADGIALKGPGTSDNPAPQAFNNCTSGVPSTDWVSPDWVSTGWIETDWVSLDSFKIDLGAPTTADWIQIKWDELTSETYKKDVVVTVDNVDPLAVEYVTDFGLEFDVYFENAQTGLETLEGSDWLGIQVLSLSGYATGASLSVDPKTQDASLDATLPGGSGEINLLAAAPQVAVPEPSTLGLLGLAALAGLAGRKRRPQ